MSTPIVRTTNYIGTIDSSLRPKDVQDSIFKRSINKKMLLFMLNSLNKVKVKAQELAKVEENRTMLHLMRLTWERYLLKNLNFQI